MIVTRIITAVIAVPVLVLMILKFPPLWFAVVLSVVAAATLVEFLMMYNVSKGAMVVTSVLGAFVVIARHEGYFGSVLLVSFEQKAERVGHLLVGLVREVHVVDLAITPLVKRTGSVHIGKGRGQPVAYAGDRSVKVMDDRK